MPQELIQDKKSANKFGSMMLAIANNVFIILFHKLPVLKLGDSGAFFLQCPESEVNKIPDIRTKTCICTILGYDAKCIAHIHVRAIMLLNNSSKVPADDYDKKLDSMYWSFLRCVKWQTT